MKILHIDIEAAPAKAYVWGLKTRYVPLNQISEDGYILCFSYRWEGSDEIGTFTLWDHGYKNMIQGAWDLLDEADAIITYNGNGYDLPMLNTEFLVSRLGPPTPYHSIDLFRTVSSKFRVLSKSMKHMLHLLSLDNKLEHKGMELWTGCMAGVKEDQKVMEEYNVQDVIVMEDLYKELLPWIDSHPNRGLWMESGEDHVCPNCGGKHLRFKGYKRTRVLSYKQYHCQDCGFYPRERFAQETGAKRRRDILT
jgi:predicted RNA-binding Zn-ribbon protein involved in translation (DUF1610 family)